MIIYYQSDLWTFQEIQWTCLNGALSMNTIPAGMTFGKGAGGHLPPRNLNNSDFFVFLHTTFCFIHILPPIP